MIPKSLLYSSIILGVLGQFYEDKRCRCVCPSPAEVLDISTLTEPKLFIAHVPPSQCNCLGVILPRIGGQLDGREPEYCLRCECKFETRNTAIIKVSVITIMCLLTLLIIYSLFLLCLDPFMRKQREQHQVQQQLHQRYRKDDSEESRHLISDSDEETEQH